MAQWGILLFVIIEDGYNGYIISLFRLPPIPTILQTNHSNQLLQIQSSEPINQIWGVSLP